jgi:hypothetical protein
MGPIFRDMVNISLREQFIHNSCNIQLLSLKLVLPLSFARLGFRVCEGQPFLNWLYISGLIGMTYLEQLLYGLLFTSPYHGGLSAI